MREVYGQYSQDMKLADLHIHTNASDGIVTPRERVDFAVAEKLDLIAITDHEVIEPAIDAKEYSLRKGYPLEVVGIARNLYGSMVLEPTRRIQRFAMRKLNFNI